jgi:hypothetical protein
MFFSLVSIAQKEPRCFVSLENSVNKNSDCDFFIEKVYDGRQINSNIGSVQRPI